MDAALGIALEVLTFQAGYNATVVTLGATCLGVAAGVVGTFTFLRQRALISDAMSHATLPGVVLAFLFGVAMGLEDRSLPLLLAGAALTGGLGVFLVQLIARSSRITEDTAIGIVLSVFYGLGIVLLTYVQSLTVGGQAGLKSFILGQTAAMRRDEAIGLAVLAAAAIVSTALLFKEFRLVCFDSEFAQGLGWPVFRIDLLMAGLSVLVTVIGLQTVGLILIVALLILPPVAARFWSDDLRVIVPLSGCIGGASAWIGAALSAAFADLPTGGIIVLVAGALFGASLLLAPRRGVLANGWRRVSLAGALHRDRALVRMLRAEREGRRSRVGVGMRLWLLLSGYWRDGALTESGRRGAMAVERNFRLWEQVLREDRALVPPDAAFGIDPVERLLTAEQLRTLEKGLLLRPAQGAAP